MANHNIAVEIDHISKKIKNKQLLAPLSYRLERKKILALCGGNGAGKSTLIRLITGLIKPTTGSVTLNGFQLKKHKQHFLNEIGYMPDDFQFHKSITAKETIHFYAKLKKINEGRINETIGTVGLLDNLHEKVGTFSKGMNQRLLLAQALLAKPNILILDEPTNGLDPYWVKRFTEIMLQAKSDGQTIIFSTHDLHVAEHIADEVMFLSNGEVISKGAVEQYKDIGLHKTFQQLYFKRLKNNHTSFDK